MISTEGSARYVRCPTCMDYTPWPTGDTVYKWDSAKREYVRKAIGNLDPENRKNERRFGYQPCTSRSGGFEAEEEEERHYIPANYAEYQEPLVVGLVGGSQKGKTHLLTAMIREIENGGLQPYDLEVEALDFRKRAQFTEEYLEPFEHNKELPGTRSGVLDFTESLLVSGRTGLRPVIFFDVAGEDLRAVDATDRYARFLIAAGAVLIVHAPDDELTLNEISARGGSVAFASRHDQAIRLSLAKIKAAANGRPSLPAAVAVTKSDRLRFRPPADFWLRRGSEPQIDASRVRAESRDVFAFLRQRGDAATLSTYSAFDRCAMHFVSATGGDSQNKGFPRGIRPIRVLEPLVSIFAMTGILSGPEAQKVGTP